MLKKILISTRKDTFLGETMLYYILSNGEKGGNLMMEQENYKKMLRNLIRDTENQKFNTSEEIIQKIISELGASQRLKKYTEKLAK